MITGTKNKKLNKLTFIIETYSSSKWCNLVKVKSLLKNMKPISIKVG